MLINVYCPSCQTLYRLDPALRGKATRCPNTACRAVFIVEEAAPEAPADNASSPVQNREEPGRRTTRASAHVQEILPLLDAELAVPGEPPAEPLESPAAPPGASWHEPPPVRPPKAPAAEGAPPAPAGPQPLDWRTAPPPARRTPGTPPAVPTPKPERPAKVVPSYVPTQLESPAPPPAPLPATRIEPPQRPRPRPAPEVRTPTRIEEPPAPPLPEPVAEPQHEGPPDSEPSNGPVVLGPGEWEAPPVRAPSAPPPEAPTCLEDEYARAAAARRRRNRRMMYGIAGAVLGVFAVAGVLAWLHIRDAEERAFAEARKDYDSQNYTAAGPKFDQLAQRFPDSEKAPLYHFLAELCDVRAQVLPVDPEPPAALTRMQEFLKTHAQDPLLRDHYPDVWLTLVRLREDLLKEAREKLDEPLIAQTKQALELSKQYKPLDSTDPALQDELAKDRGKVKELEANLQEVQVAIAKEKKRRAILARGDQIIKQGPNAERIRGFKALARREGFEQDSAVLAKLKEIEQARLEAVVYTPRGEKLPQIRPVDTDPSLLISPPLGGFHSTLPTDRDPQKPPRVVFALIRGVLYALRLQDGEVLWATRVGIDQTTLPIRLPREGSVPERVLVLSSDNNTLTARDVANGRQLWQHRLSGPCLSRPVIVGNRAYLGTVNGRVEEIEIVQGRFLGWYQVGEPLLVGGAHQEGTNLLYFPADSESVFVLDTAVRRCALILDTGHPSGSLRGEPIAVTRVDPNAPPNPNPSLPGSLILCQTDGLDTMRLHVFDLPITDAHALPYRDRNNEEPAVRGWSWLTPYCDGETLLLATDEGVLGIFGIKQIGNDDPPLFPAIQQTGVFPPPLPGNVSLFPGAPQAAERDVTRAERAQVVRLSEADFAIMVRGQLQRLHFDLLNQRVARMWPPPVGPLTQQIPKPLTVGFPLHGGQLDDELHALVVVTQAGDGQTCLATAVDTERGTIHWQRQLGMVCQAPPFLVSRRPESRPEVVAGLLAVAPNLGMPAGMPAALALPVAREEVSLVASGKEGAMYRFNSEDMPYRPDLEWYINSQVLAEPVKEPLVGPVHFLHTGIGQPLYTVASSPLNANDYQLVVRRYEADKASADQFTVPLPGAPLGGTPALRGKWLTMPLADGNLAQAPLEEGGKSEPGPRWRAAWADKRNPGHIVALNESEILVTDGLRGVQRLKWPLGTRLFQQLGNYQFPARIVAAPVLVSTDSVCVATSHRVLTLLGTRDLKPITTWSFAEVGRQITAGPFVRTWGGRTWIGCILDHRRLVWIDPDRPRPAWRQPYEAPETIVGEPQLIGDVLLVADQTGRFVGLDPRTGRQRGPGYTLRANVTPATAPVAFGTDRAFVPLTDGTVLLLSMGHFRGEPSTD